MPIWMTRCCCAANAVRRADAGGAISPCWIWWGSSDHGRKPGKAPDTPAKRSQNSARRATGCRRQARDKEVVRCRVTDRRGSTSGKFDAATRDHRRWHDHAGDGGGGRAWPTGEPRVTSYAGYRRLTAIRWPIDISVTPVRGVFRKRWEQVFVGRVRRPATIATHDAGSLRVGAIGPGVAGEKPDLGHRPGRLIDRFRVVVADHRDGVVTPAPLTRQLPPTESARFPNPDRTRGIRQSRLDP